MATDTNNRTPWSTPQPIDPSSHSPSHSDVPMTSRKTAKMTRPMASAPSAATLPTSPAIAPASALARSTCAGRAAMRGIARRAPIWSRRPGGGRRGPPGGGGSAAGSAGGGSRAAASRDRGSRSDRPGECSRSVRARGVGFDDSSAPEWASHPAERSVTLRKHDNLRTPPTPDRRAAEHRQRADRRRDARHERRGAGPIADRDGRPGDPPDRAPRRPRPGHRRVHDRPGPSRPRRLDRRARARHPTT